jgi:hypothetical protein
MDSNTHSTRPPRRPGGLAGLAAAVDDLAAQDLDRLPDTVRAERVLRLRRMLDRLEGHWLKELAGVDGRGAAGADQDQQAGSTAGGRPAPTRTSRLARPPAGCGAGCG